MPAACRTHRRVCAGAQVREAREPMRRGRLTIPAAFLCLLGCADPVEKARAAHERGRDEEAVRLYTQALARRPEPDAAAELAEIYLAKGQIRLALATLEPVQDQVEAPLWARLGLRLSEAGELEAASAAYARALERDPKNSLAIGGKHIVDSQLRQRRRIEAVRATAAEDLAAFRAAFDPSRPEGPAPPGLAGRAARFRPYLTPGWAAVVARRSASRGLVGALTVGYDQLELTAASTEAVTVDREGDGLSVRRELRSMSVRRGRGPGMEGEWGEGEGPAVTFKLDAEGRVQVLAGVDDWVRALDARARASQREFDPSARRDAPSFARSMQGWLDAAPAFDGGRYAGTEEGTPRKAGDHWHGMTFVEDGSGPRPVHVLNEFVGWATLGGLPVAKVRSEVFGHPRHRYQGDSKAADAFFAFKKGLGEVAERWGDPDGPVTGSATRWIEPRTMIVLREEVLHRGWMSTSARGAAGGVEYVHTGLAEVKGLLPAPTAAAAAPPAGAGPKGDPAGG